MWGLVLVIAAVLAVVIVLALRSRASIEREREARRKRYAVPETSQRVPLAHGVSLVLCADHRDPRFIASHSGRDFLAAISALYESLGLTSGRFERALRDFVDRCANLHRHAGTRPRPGSYAWPARRQACANGVSGSR